MMGYHCNTILLIFLFVNILLTYAQVDDTTKIVLKNNAYSQFVVGISEAIEENHTLIDNIKEIFTNASYAMYTALR